MDLDDLLKSIREEKDEEIPEGLDDLLSSIRGGEKKSVDVKKVFGDEKVEKYRMELVAEGKIPGTKENASPEEIKEGFKLYRRDKQEFKTFVEKVLQKKASAGGGFGGGDAQLPPGSVATPPPSAKPTQLLLPGTAEEPQKEQKKTRKKAKIKKDPLLEKLDVIIKSVTSIESLISKDLKLDKDLAERERKQREREKGEKKEKFREKFKSMIGAPVKKLLEPVKSLFDMIFDAITKILLGAALMRFLEWIGDPENQKKLGNIFKFLSKFWPALLAIYLAFGNGFTRALLRMTGGLLRFVPKLVMIAAKLAFKAGKMLLGAIVRNPVAALTTAVVGGTAIMALKANQDDTAKIKDAKNPKKSHADEINEFGGMTGSPMGGLFSGGGSVPNLSPAGHSKNGTGGAVKGFSGGGPVPKSTSNSKNGGKNFPPKNRPISLLSGGGQVVNFNLHMSSGGEVPGINFSPTINYLSGGGKPMGTDTVPAMLTPGEFVMSRGAVQKYGVDTFEEMNAAGGGTNRPKFLGGISYAQGGGGVNRRGRRTGSKSQKPTQNTATEKDTTKGTNTNLEGGGGGPAVINAGKQILAKGYTVAEHPNFRKNSWSRQGPNTGVGFNPGGGERVGGHSGGSLHYKGLAIDVTDWRPGDWLGRTRALAESIYQNRAALKVTQIIHDPWGSWFAGGGKGGAIGGHGTHLHLGFAGGPGGGSIGDPASSGGGGGGGGSGGVDASGGATGGYQYDPNFDMGPGAKVEDTSYLDPGRFFGGSGPNFLKKDTTSESNLLRQVQRRQADQNANAAYLQATSPSNLNNAGSSGIVDLTGSGAGAEATTQAAAPTRGTTYGPMNPDDENNVFIYGVRALHNIIF